MIQNITQKKPSECTDITEVRSEIDHIDRVIVELLAERFEYVKEVVKYKENTPGSIEAPERRNAVIECRRRWAEECGLSADVIEQMYQMLIGYFIEEEKKVARCK